MNHTARVRSRCGAELEQNVVRSTITLLLLGTAASGLVLASQVNFLAPHGTVPSSRHNMFQWGRSTLHYGTVRTMQVRHRHVISRFYATPMMDIRSIDERRVGGLGSYLSPASNGPIPQNWKVTEEPAREHDTKRR